MSKTPRLKLIIAVYWVLLIYIVAALVWWFIALERQNNKMTNLLLNELRIGKSDYNKRREQIENERKHKTAQYIGEGTTFLVLILVGAVFVYRATRRQIRLSIQQQNFMMAITHELKTPIAISTLNLETLQKRKLEAAQQEKLITVTLQEVNRLNSLCNNIILASQLDNGRYKSEKSAVNLSITANKVIRDFNLRYPKRNVSGIIANGISIMGEELLLELLMTNLVENAIKYSDKDAPVSVHLFLNNGYARLSVADEGAGIPESEREKIFQKFYRIGNEETRTAKGTGLGLYLCRQIARDHGAVISIKDNGNKGSIFTVDFSKEKII